MSDSANKSTLYSQPSSTNKSPYEILNMIYIYFKYLDYNADADNKTKYEDNLFRTEIFTWKYSNITVPESVIKSNKRKFEKFFIEDYFSNGLANQKLLDSGKSLFSIFTLIWISIFKNYACDTTINNIGITEILDKLSTLEKIINHYVQNSYDITTYNDKNETILFDFLPIYNCMSNLVKAELVPFKYILTTSIPDRMNFIREKFEWIESITKKLLNKFEITNHINHKNFMGDTILLLSCSNMELLKMILNAGCDISNEDRNGYTIIDYLLGIEMVSKNRNNNSQKETFYFVDKNYHRSIETLKILIKELLTKSTVLTKLNVFGKKKRDGKHVGHRIANYAPSLIYTTELFNQQNINDIWNMVYFNNSFIKQTQPDKQVKIINERVYSKLSTYKVLDSMLAMIFNNTKIELIHTILCFDDEHYLAAKLLLEAGVDCPDVEDVVDLFYGQILTNYQKKLEFLDTDRGNLKFELEARLDNCTKHWLDLIILYIEYCKQENLKEVSGLLRSTIIERQNEIFAVKYHKKAMKLLLLTFKYTYDPLHPEYNRYSDMIQKDGSIILDQREISPEFKMIYDYIQDNPPRTTFTVILQKFDMFFKTYVENYIPTVQVLNENERIVLTEGEATVYELLDNYSSPQFEKDNKIDLPEILPAKCPTLQDKAFDVVMGPYGDNPTLDSLKDDKSQYIFIYGNGIMVLDYDVLEYTISNKSDWIYACRGLNLYTPSQMIGNKVSVDKQFTPFVKLSDFYIPAADLIKVVKYKKARILFIVPEEMMENDKIKQKKYDYATDGRYLLSPNASRISGWHCQDGTSFGVSKLVRAKEGSCSIVNIFESEKVVLNPASDSLRNEFTTKYGYKLKNIPIEQSLLQDAINKIKNGANFNDIQNLLKPYLE